MMNTFGPPPPPLQGNMENAKHVGSCQAKEDSTITAIKQWAQLCGVTNDNPRKLISMWRSTPTILQNGPQCGLVALTMAAQALGYPIDLPKVFDLAIQSGMTKQGEMFSGVQMHILACSLKVDAVLLEDGLNDLTAVLSHLNAGKLLLVPYDADCNHSPCLKRGHKAHWALVFGVLLEVDLSLDLSHCQAEDLDTNVHRIVSGLPYVSPLVKKPDVHLLAKQGKSKRSAIWSYSSLEASNANLFEVDPKRNSPADYVLPCDNKLDDLRSKVIVLG